MLFLANNCYSCGSPFPWFDNELKKLNAVMAIDSCLNDEEKALLLQCIPDLTIDFDGTITSAALVKGLTEKAATATKSFIIELIKSIAVDSVKDLFLK